MSAAKLNREEKKDLHLLLIGNDGMGHISSVLHQLQNMHEDATSVKYRKELGKIIDQLTSVEEFFQEYEQLI